MVERHGVSHHDGEIPLRTISQVLPHLFLPPSMPYQSPSITSIVSSGHSPPGTPQVTITTFVRDMVLKAIPRVSYLMSSSPTVVPVQNYDTNELETSSLLSSEQPE